ncbi:MAG: PQQ-binding-like beta-propeller repeat protein [Planctomycetales bacterium]|nr:PQQ-binding-like beta-propeller repeat protein [Planctomycetales bacterium]
MDKPGETRGRDKPRTGSINRQAIEELIAGLRRNNFIGTLHVSAGDSEKYVYFSVGGIRLLSTGSRKYTSVGRLLVRRGRITQADLADALGVVETSGARLGDHLVQKGLATKADLEETVRLQVENEILDVVTWDDGIYQFHVQMPGDLFERKARATAVSLDIDALLGKLSASAERFEKIRTRIPTFRLVFRPTPAGRSALDVVETPPARRDFLQLVDGSRPLDEIATTGEFGRFELAELAFEALREELVQPVGGVGRTAAVELDEIQTLEAALDKALTDVLIRRKLAEAYERAGETGKAVENYRRLAEERLRQYQDDEAISALESVTRLQPTDFSAHEQLLECYDRTGRSQKVVDHGTRLGELYRTNRLYNRAKNVLLRLIGLSPKNLKVKTLLADTYADLGDSGAAVKEYESAVGVLRDEGKTDPGTIRSYAEKILLLDEGNRLARRLLGKLGERAAPLAPLARAAALLATLGVVGAALASEYDARVRYREAARRARPLVEAGAFDQVLSEVEELRRSRFSTLAFRLAETEKEIRDRRDADAVARLEHVLVRSEELDRGGEPEEALAALRRELDRVSAANLPGSLRERAQGRLEALTAALEGRVREWGRVADALAQAPPDDRAAFDAWRRTRGGRPPSGKLEDLPPVRIPVQTVPAGAEVSSPDGAPHGVTGPEKPVPVPLRLGKPLRVRVALAGYAPAVVEIPPEEVVWPVSILLRKEVRFSYALGGPPSGPPLPDAGGLWCGSVDRHLYRLGPAGELRAAIALGLTAEVVGAPAALPGPAGPGGPGETLALVATRDRELRGFADPDAERLRLLLPEPPAWGPVVAEGWLVQALSGGDVLAVPIPAARAAAPGAHLEDLPGVRRVRVGATLAGPPLVAEGRVVAATAGGRLLSEELATGARRFDLPLGAGPVGGPTADPRGLLFLAFRDGRVEARYLSGEAAWTEPGRVPGGAASAPIPAGEVVVVGGATGGATALDVRTGQKVHEFRTDAPVRALPAPSGPPGEVLVLGDESGRLSAYAVGGGRRLLWTFETGAPIRVAPRPVAGAWLVVSEAGLLVAVRE